MFFRFLTFTLLFASLYASEVEITAKRFDGDDKGGVSKFSGSVKAVKGSDTILSDTLFIYFDQARKPIRFEAIGNANFVVKEESGKNYRGKAKTIIYYPNQKEYQLIGDAFVEYIEENRRVYGDKIVVNDATKKATVSGEESGKPAKFIFYIDDKNDTKKSK